MSTERRRSAGPSRKQIAEHWGAGTAERRGEESLHCDIGEPSCWACHAYVVDEDTEGTTRAYNAAAWLERCHLVAHAAGGEFTVENCVLLCHDCHKMMDRELGSNTDRDAALYWVRSYRKRFTVEFAATLKALQVDQSAVSLDNIEQFSEMLHAEMDGASRSSPVAMAMATKRAIERMATA